MVTSFVGKITELLSVLITNQFEEFSKDLMKKIEEKEIQNIEDIRSLWNSKCKENVLNISNCSISLKIKNNSKKEKKTVQIKKPDLMENSSKSANAFASENEPLSQNVSEIKKDDTCHVILNKGKNKGKECGKKCRKNEEYCYLHFRTINLKKNKSNDTNLSDNENVTISAENINTSSKVSEDQTKENEVCFSKKEQNVNLKNSNRFNDEFLNFEDGNTCENKENNDDDDEKKENNDDDDEKKEDNDDNDYSDNDDSDNDDSDNDNNSDNDNDNNDSDSDDSDSDSDYDNDNNNYSVNDNDNNNDNNNDNDNSDNDNDNNDNSDNDNDDNDDSDNDNDNDDSDNDNDNKNKNKRNKKEKDPNKVGSIVDNYETYLNEYGEIVIVGYTPPTDEERYRKWYAYLTLEERKDKNEVKRRWEERETRRLRTLAEMKKLEEAREKIKNEKQQTYEEFMAEYEEKQRKYALAVERKRLRDLGLPIEYTKEELQQQEDEKRAEQRERERIVNEKYFGISEKEEYEKFIRGEDNKPEIKCRVFKDEEERLQAKKERDERVARYWKEQERKEQEEKERREQEEKERKEREEKEKKEREKREEERRKRIEMEEREQEERRIYLENKRKKAQAYREAMELYK